METSPHIPHPKESYQSNQTSTSRKHASKPRYPTNLHITQPHNPHPHTHHLLVHGWNPWWYCQTSQSQATIITTKQTQIKLKKN